MSEIVGKATEFVKAHAGLSFAFIIVCVIVILSLLVYYRGVGPLGPYNKPDVKKVEEKSDDKPDPDTKKLIDDINSKSKTS